MVAHGRDDRVGFHHRVDVGADQRSQLSLVAIMTQLLEIDAGCAYGDTDSDRSIVLFGDSHADQWEPALNAVALREGWRLELQTKNGCTPFDIRRWHDGLGRVLHVCDTWRRRVMVKIAAERPMAVLVSRPTPWTWRSTRTSSRSLVS